MSLGGNVGRPLYAKPHIVLMLPPRRIAPRVCHAERAYLCAVFCGAHAGDVVATDAQEADCAGDVLSGADPAQEDIERRFLFVEVEPRKRCKGMLPETKTPSQLDGVIVACPRGL